MKNKIKDTALKHFKKNGYEQTSMSNIALELGIEESIIYKFYINKEEILFKIIEDLFDDIMNKVEIYANVTDLSKIDIKDALYNIFKGYYHYFAEHDSELYIWQRLRFFPPDCVKGKFDINYLFYERPLIDLYINLFQQGIRNKQLKNSNEGILAMTFLAYFSGFIDSLSIIPFELSECELKEVFEIYWDGIRYNESVEG
jgi:AcrR family transcriptional regulator